MWTRLASLFFLLGSVLANHAQAQNIDTLIFLGMDTLAHKASFQGHEIKELSGIEYYGEGNQYLLVPQSKENAHLFLCTIEITASGIQMHLDSVMHLATDVLEGESIRINPSSHKIYIAEEQDKASYIYELDKDNHLKTIYTSQGPLRNNRGYEGLCFSKDGSKMFIGLESPLKGNITSIISYNLIDGSEQVYEYALDVLENDKKQDNGITELLTLNDSTLLVVERAFLGPVYGDSIRVYKAILPTEGNVIVKEKLLTDFSTVPRIDNIEGVSFSASGNELIFISDNNGNAHQQTQFICMKIQ